MVQFYENEIRERRLFTSTTLDFIIGLKTMTEIEGKSNYSKLGIQIEEKIN